MTKEICECGFDKNNHKEYDKMGRPDLNAGIEPCKKFKPRK